MNITRSELRNHNDYYGKGEEMTLSCPQFGCLTINSHVRRDPRLPAETIFRRSCYGTLYCICPTYPKHKARNESYWFYTNARGGNGFKSLTGEYQMADFVVYNKGYTTILSMLIPCDMIDCSESNDGKMTGNVTYDLATGTHYARQ
jgi:ribosomal protein L36